MHGNFFEKNKKSIDKISNTYYNKYCKDKKPVDTSLGRLPEWNPKLKGGKTMKKDTIVVIGEALVSVVAEIWKDRNEKKEGESDS